MRIKNALTLATAVACALAQPVFAAAGPDKFPVRPIRLILPVGPGGGQEALGFLEIVSEDR